MIISFKVVLMRNKIAEYQNGIIKMITNKQILSGTFQLNKMLKDFQLLDKRIMFLTDQNIQSKPNLT